MTTACMNRFQESFNDDCHELTVLRWFRDHYVSKEDVEHYYEVAPIIVESINREEQKNAIYDYIYNNVINYCVSQIEIGNYDAAYSRYKNTVLCFEKLFIKMELQYKEIKTLKKIKK